jgi:hypothetical protein
MKIEMKDTVCTPFATFKNGHVYDVSPKRGKKWVERGLAKSLKEETRTPPKRKTSSLPHGDKG